MTLASVSSRTRWLRSIVGFHSGEGQRVAIMIVYSAAALGGVLTVGQAASDALFVGQLPATDMPFLFILPAFSIVPLLFFYNRLVQRFRLDRIIIGSNWLLLALVALFRILFATSIGRSFGVLAGYYLITEFSYTLVILQFWTIAGQIFDVREAKRLYGLIAAGGTLANIAAGLSIGSLARSIGVENLLFIVMAALLICMLCVRLLTRSISHRSIGPAAVQPEAGSTRSSFIQDVHTLWQAPLLRAMGGLTVLLSLLINVGAYEFFLSAQANFAGRSSDLAAYLGTFEFLAGIAAAIVQFYLSARIMRRGGVFVALLLFPLGMLVSAGLSLITAGALWAMTLIRAADPVFRRTITAAGLNVLYLPLAADLRRRASELFEILYAFTFGIAGLLFLPLQSIPTLNAVDYSIPVVILSVLWIALLVWTRPQYQRALADALKKRTLDFEGARIDIHDEATAQVIIRALHQTDELQILNALHLIEAAPNVDWGPHLLNLLQHPSPDVQITVLNYLARVGQGESLVFIRPLLAGLDERVCAAAIEAYCAIDRDHAVERIAPLLNSASPGIQGAAATNLIKYAAAADQALAEHTLDSLLESSEAAYRSEAARAIGSLGHLDRAPVLQRLLNDSSADVRLAAIRAAGELRAPDLIQPLIHCLCDKTAASAAIGALTQYGSSIELDLAAILTEAESDRTVRVQLPSVLRHIGTATAAQILIERLREPDDLIRLAIETALVRLSSSRSAVVVSADVLKTAIMAELQHHYSLIVLRRDLSQTEIDLLLDDTLAARIDQSLDRVFLLLDLMYPGRKVARVRDALRSDKTALKASAIEFLDNLAEHHIKAILLPAIEAPATQVLDIAHRQFGLQWKSVTERLAELLRSDDAWLRVCALHRLGTLASRDWADPIRQALQSADELTRETALVAGRSIFERDEYRRVLQDQSIDDRFPGVQRYAREQLQQI